MSKIRFEGEERRQKPGERDSIASLDSIREASCETQSNDGSVATSIQQAPLPKVSSIEAPDKTLRKNIRKKKISHRFSFSKPPRSPNILSSTFNERFEIENKKGHSFEGVIHNYNMQSSFIGPGPVTSIKQETPGQDDNLNVKKYTIKDLYTEKLLRMNLLCSILVWLLGSFNLYLITFFLKYFPGNVYLNSICFACADILAFLSSGFVLKFLRINIGLVMSYSISFVASIFYFFNYVNPSNSWVIPLIISFTRFGGMMSFNVAYVSVSRLFPTALVTTVFGIVNFMSHIITVGAPVVAELPQPTPFIVFSANAGLAVLIGVHLKELDHEKRRQKQIRQNKMKNFIKKQAINDSML